MELEKIVPAALTAQILTTGFVGTDAAALGRSQSEEAAGGLWTQCAAASESLMEEGVTEPEPQAVELTGMPPGTPSEVNGDLPGNPYLRDGAGVMESPVREPAVLQYPAEYSQQYG